MILLPLLILVLFTSHVRASLSLIADGERVVTIPTFDYFEYPAQSFEARGHPVFAKLIPADPDLDDPKRGHCAVQPAEPFPTGTKLKHIVENCRESIMIMQWNMASKCGTVTFSQLWPLAKELAQQIEEAGLPPSKTLVIALSTRYKGLEANPFEERYRSNLAGVSDEPPPKDLQVVLFGLNSGKEFIKADMENRKQAELAEYAVESELDPWNAAFTSIAFRIFNWLYATINIVFILLACVRIGQIISRGKFEFDLRNAIFLLGVIGAFLYVVTFFFPIRSRRRRLVTNVAGYCETVAFHLLLYLWSVFMKQIRQINRQGIIVFRGIVFTSVGVVTLTFIAQMIIHNARTGRVVTRMVSVVTWMLPVMQFIIAFTFAFYSWSFHQKREAAKISARTQKALFRLTVLAVVAFICYLGISITNIPAIKDVSIHSPGGAVFNHFYLTTVFTLRNVSLLAILTVKAPKREISRSDSVTSSTITAVKSGEITSVMSVKEG